MGAKRKTAFSAITLLSDTEFVDYCTVTSDILLHEVVEKVSSVTDHLKKTSSGVMVILVCLEMLGESADSVCKDSYLYFGRTCIALVGLILLDDRLLFVLLHHCCIPPLR